MGHSIAVMNTKGGVGKSTLVMALAETLSVVHGKNVLVIDSDSQTSMSHMLMHETSWEQMERQNRTLADFMIIQTLGKADAQWTDFVARGVSDVEDAKSVFLIPSHMELSLFEREVSAQRKDADLRAVVRKLLDETMRMFDIVLIDCPPGLSLLTECWLREVEYFMPPIKPDYLAVRGLGILKKFREDYAAQGFAELLGIVINMKDGRIASEEEWHSKLQADPENRLFQTYIPRRAYIQRAADFLLEKRTYIAKYPGDAGTSIRALSKEILQRLETNDAAKTAAMAVRKPAAAGVAPVKAATAMPPPAKPAPAAPLPATAPMSRPMQAAPAMTPPPARMAETSPPPPAVNPMSMAAQPPASTAASAMRATVAAVPVMPAAVSPAAAAPVAVPRPAMATLDTSTRVVEPQGKILLGQLTPATMAAAAKSPAGQQDARAVAAMRPIQSRAPAEHGLTLVEDNEAGD
jgi:chromosome partitioning protein